MKVSAGERGERECGAASLLDRGRSTRQRITGKAPTSFEQAPTPWAEGGFHRGNELETVRSLNEEKQTQTYCNRQSVAGEAACSQVRLRVRGKQNRSWLR